MKVELTEKEIWLVIDALESLENEFVFGDGRCEAIVERLRRTLKKEEVAA